MKINEKLADAAIEKQKEFRLKKRIIIKEEILEENEAQDENKRIIASYFFNNSF